MAIGMSVVMSCIMTGANTGFGNGFLYRWWSALRVGFVVALPLSYILPIVINKLFELINNIKK